MPELAAWASSDQVLWREALDDLAMIGTAEAACVLVPFLWDQDANKASQAAWHVGGLLALNPVEESLRDLDLSKIQRYPSTLDWVWRPFQAKDAPDSALPAITGRIADLLGQRSRSALLHHALFIDPRLAIPLCAIVLVDKTQLPTTLTAKAEFLLEQPGDDPYVEQEIIKELKVLLGGTRQSHWEFVLSGLGPKQQLDLLVRLINAPRLPLAEDWRQLYKPVDYDFKTGWHYRLVLILTLAASLIALWGMVLFLIPQQHVWASGFIGLAAIVVLTFWLFLWRGIGERLEPTTFIRFGPRGPISFYDEFRRFLKEDWVWARAEPLAESALAGAWAVAVALAVALAVAGAGAVAWSGAVAWAWAVAAGYGVEVWEKQNYQKTVRFRFMAIFAFPFFCGLPIIILFSTVALSHVFLWPMAIVLELGILGLCTILWKRGQTLHRRSQNPLHGILDVKS